MDGWMDRKTDANRWIDIKKMGGFIDIGGQTWINTRTDSQRATERRDKNKIINRENNK